MRRVNYEDGRIGPHEQGNIGPIGRERLVRSYNHSEYSGRLILIFSKAITRRVWVHTFVCHMVKEVGEITAKR